MKKLFIFILLSSFIFSETVIITPDLIYKSIGKSIKTAISSNVRYFTNTQTDKEECRQKQGRYFVKSREINAELYRENRKIKQILYPHKIDYTTILEQQGKITLDFYEIKRKTCSKSFFELMVRNQKTFQQTYRNNKILKQLLLANNISFKTTITFDNVDLEKEDKHKKAINALKLQLNN